MDAEAESSSALEEAFSENEEAFSLALSLVLEVSGCKSSDFMDETWGEETSE